MDFRRVEFLDYMINGCKTAEFSVCSSEVPPVAPEEFGLEWEDIFLNSPERDFSAEIREAIAARYSASPDSVYTNAGSTITAFMTIAAIFDEPGAAIIEKPVYHPLQDALGIFTNDIRSLPRWFEDGWVLDLEELGRIWDPSVRVIVLTNLNNPTGVRTTDDEIRAVAEFAGRSGGYVLVDEVFREYDFDAAPGCAANVAPNVITVNSFTKSFGLGYQRFGWFIGPKNILDRIEEIGWYFAVGDHLPAVGILLKAFENIEMLRARAKKFVDEGFPVFKEWVESRDELECIIPDVGPMAFPRLKDGDDTEQIAKSLLEKNGILLAPGRYFGDPSGFRIGYAMPADKLRDGLNALGIALDERASSG